MSDRFQLNVAAEAEFWRKQLHEHALFTWWAAVQAPLKARAEILVRQGEHLPSVEAVAGYAAALAEVHRALRGEQDRGVWEGYFYPSLVEAWIREEEAFVRLAGDPTLSAEDGYRSLARGLSASAGHLARLLDPLEKPMAKALEEREAAFTLLASATLAPDGSTLLANSAELLRREAEYVQILQSTELRAARRASPPLLVDHDAREAGHGAAILAAMTGARAA